VVREIYIILSNTTMKPLNQNKMRQIVYNSVKCLECNKVLVSRHRHDYVTCGCPNDAMADGGNEYERYGAMDMDKIETHYVYADDDFEIVRKYAVRGSRGKYGETELMNKEIEYRKNGKNNTGV